jgi:sugar fermentation stimulation protein A
MKMRCMCLFANVIHGIFIRRLHRFAVECELDGEIIQAHLPNPGRLWELLLPGRIVSLVRNDSAPERSTVFTAVAVYRDGIPVLLHTQKANTVARFLLENNKIRGLEHGRIIKQEAVFGESRFDFLLQKSDTQYVLEVKSCTLFGKHIAMFPDAVTERGRKHLLTLAELAEKGMHCGVIFIVHWSRGRYFLPDYHTDFDFAKTFFSLKDKLMYRAVSITWKDDLSLGDDVSELEIPWRVLARESHNGGSYILILHILQDSIISVGSLGHVSFPPGYYIYVGSARTNLTKRIERHLRKRKNFFWHIDYLRDHADKCLPLAIRSHTLLEHEVALAVSRIADWSVPGFGSSDCFCETHLFAMHENPIHSHKFLDLLQYFRMDRLGRDLR